MIRQPFPCATASSISCSVNVDTPLAGNFRYILPGAIRSAKKPHTFLSKYSFCVLLTAIICSVFDFIHRIFRAAGPIKVPGIDAFSDTAAMRRVSQIGGTLAVNDFANASMNSIFNPVNSDTGITAVIDGKRPQNAGIGLCFGCRQHEFDSAKIFAIDHLARDTHSLLVSQGN